MKSIIHVGMDVHTTNYTLCCYRMDTDEIFAVVKTEPDAKNILKYIEQIKKNHGQQWEIQCGYEAGVLGYSLYHQLTDQGIDCVILAPSTMPKSKKRELKTDKRDAAKVARCLAYRTYSRVHIPNAGDNAVKEYIRMRDDAKETVKKLKQRILSFCTRNGKQYSGGKSYWTQRHLAWLKQQSFGEEILQEAYEEYLLLYHQAFEKVQRFDKRIAEIAQTEQYQQQVKKLSCLIGVSMHIALATLVETGDFKRFATAGQYSSLTSNVAKL